LFVIISPSERGNSLVRSSSCSPLLFFLVRVIKLSIISTFDSFLHYQRQRWHKLCVLLPLHLLRQPLASPSHFVPLWSLELRERGAHLRVCHEGAGRSHPKSRSGRCSPSRRRDTWSDDADTWTSFPLRSRSLYIR